MIVARGFLPRDFRTPNGARNSSRERNESFRLLQARLLPFARDGNCDVYGLGLRNRTVFIAGPDEATIFQINSTSSFLSRMLGEYLLREDIRFREEPEPTNVHYRCCRVSDEKDDH